MALLLSGCDWFDSEEVSPKATLELKSLEVLEASDQFGWELLKTMDARAESGKNLVISSLSVAQALGMTTNGAGGETLSEMLDVMGFEDAPTLNEAFKNVREVLASADEKVEIEVANSVWYRETLPAKESFKNTVENYYEAAFRGLNFDDAEGSKSIINGWVNDKTRGKIPSIVDEIKPESTMFLVNAVYFLGKWQYQFNKDDTRQELFYLSDGSTVDVPLMSQECSLETAFGNDYKAVRLPYGNGSFYMVVLLPSANTTVDELISGMDNEKWGALNQSFQEQNTALYLPRFETACKFELKAPLVELGMGLAFSDMADFSNMFENIPVMIGSVKHKTFIKVDEEGTEAAAVTSVEMETTSVGPGPVQFRVDSPFVFAITEKESGAILFSGRIENPLLEE
jgi:serpin B